jgi:hypothetical protein
MFAKATGHFNVLSSTDFNDRQSFISDVRSNEDGAVVGENGLENAEFDSRFMSGEAHRIVNESSLYQEENAMLESDDESRPSETECIVDIGDEEITVEMLSKAINHSYVNLKR